MIQFNSGTRRIWVTGEGAYLWSAEEGLGSRRNNTQGGTPLFWYSPVNSNQYELLMSSYAK